METERMLTRVIRRLCGLDAFCTIIDHSLLFIAFWKFIVIVRSEEE
jgi:hypothetical protein